MESDVHLENDAPAGMTPGRPLFARAEAGKGRVFLSAGHPEATPGLRWMVARAVRWVARREAIPYAAAVVRPGLHGQEILFDKALRDEEAAHFQTLMYGESQAKMAAIRRLAAMGSWDGPLWIRGLVRSSDAQVRVCAARTLVELEWTAGIPDLEAAVRTESDAIVRADLALCLARLNAMAPATAMRGGAGGRREVAVTVDDLPLVNAGTDDAAARTAMVRKLAGAFRADQIPVTAFVVGRNTRSPGGEDQLKVWLDEGVELGNHTGTHTSLHRMGLETYEADIMAEDGPLRALLGSRGKTPRYFRHPMLQAGRTQAIKRDLTAFLADHGYAVAPVTIDNSEWIFAKAYAVALERGDKAEAAKVKAAYIPYMESKFDYWERQSQQLLGYEVKQILLFHSNALNADAMGDLLAMIERRGYTFITLDQALKDPAYALPDGYEGGAGISWLHRWAIALGGKAAILPGETECPEWVMKLAGVESE
jgi:peptidoglycan/xylan/chitin deacetylase (PgdA/CDA1 family)